MDNPYIAQYPNDLSDPIGARGFFEKFYRLSDTPDAHEEYTQTFSPEATFILASKECRGRDGRLLTATVKIEG
jgi:hypothetical protein